MKKISRMFDLGVLTMILGLSALLELRVQSASASAAGTQSFLETGEMFTERDLEQEADLEDAVPYSVEDGEDIHLSTEGVYVLSGSAEEVTVYVEAGKEDKVQLVLSGLSIVNQEKPCLWVESADKVFVTTAQDSSLTVREDFSGDADAVIYSREDLVLSGTAALNVTSSENGIVSKDDLKITGGTYGVQAGSKALAANDSIRIAGGSFLLEAGTDCLHAENETDDVLGYIYIAEGDFSLLSGDDAVHASSVVQIDGGSFVIAAGEGIEGTVIQLNDGDLSIVSGDDGINAGRKSKAYTPLVEVNGGKLTITAEGTDCDGIDSNGDLVINGGEIDINAESPLDYDGTGQWNGGTIRVNGEEIEELAD